LLAAVATAIAVVVLGWFTGAREVMHGALISIFAAALLPFAIIGGVLLLLMIVALVLTLPAAVVGADPPDVDAVTDLGEPVVEVGIKFAQPYYRFLGSRRHPVFWGIPAGGLLGALLLWVIITLVILPGETRTAHKLAEAKVAIEAIHKQTGKLPQPDANGHLVIADKAVDDGFGHPMAYAVSGIFKGGSWTLTSSGFDRSDPADDLCIEGQTGIVKWVERARTVKQMVEGLLGKQPSTKDRLAAVKALRCVNRPRE
jgi:hypothetical protein